MPVTEPGTRQRTPPPEALSPLEPGTLWERAKRQSARSLASGDREPLATGIHVLEQGGARFAVHVAAGRDRKWDVTRAQRARAIDPFMPPYEDDLFVADLGPAHALLLNKFNVIEDHLLLVTRAFEAQESALSAADFSALWACMTESDALAFYNSGPDAGASQPHKHLQLVRLPALGPAAACARDLPVRGRASANAPSYAYARASVPVGGAAEPEAAGAALEALYRGLLAEAGVKGADRALSPYNLLMTNDVMVVVPRVQAGFDRYGINAMGYAGSLLVHAPEGLDRLREIGPLAALAAAGRADG